MQNINFYGQTDPGKLRTNNEDNLIFQEIWDKNHILGVVIDGVGGYEGGEVAAEIAKSTITKHLEKYPNGERLVLLQQAVTEANNLIFEESRKQPQRSNMSCVLSAVLVEVEKRQFNMVHIGDSRLYQFHNGALSKLSHDHSYVGYREDVDDLSEEEAMNHPKRNEINRLLGDRQHNSDDRDFLEVKTFSLLPDSVLLLCSDGLTDLVTKAEITEILNQSISLKEKVQALIDKANEKGGKDNITVVLIDYQCDEIAENVKNIKNAESVENEKSQIEKEKPKSKNYIWLIVLIAILALLVGVAEGWFANDYFSKGNEKNVSVDTINVQSSQPEIDSLRIDTLRIDSLNFADTMAVKQYIQDLRDTIQVREQNIEKLKNVIQKLITIE